MTKLSPVDLQFLHLGIIKNGHFNENDIAESEIAKLGVGRILDQLASLKERNLISMKKDGSFSITEDARKILWNSQTSTEIKILRVLEIAPQMPQKLASILLIPEAQIQNTIEELQKNHFVLMSTIKNELGIVKFYEILPEGIEYLHKKNSDKTLNFSKINPHLKNIKILQSTIEEIKKLREIQEDTKNKIISNLQNVQKNLEL